MSGFDILGPEGLPSPRLIGGGGDSLPQEIGGDGEVSRTSFSTYLDDVFGEIAKLDDDVKSKYEALARGEPGVEVHDLMTAMGKSEVAFNLMLEMRNKIVEAWQTLSRSVV